MEKRTNAAARALAAIALVGAAVILIAILAGSLGGGSGSSDAGRHTAGHAAAKGAEHPSHGATYVVRTGDTLTAIAHRTGVPVARILSLNPEVDPQILIAGEKLKLR